MKRIFFLLIFIGLLIECHPKLNQVSDPIQKETTIFTGPPKFQFDSTSFRLGAINKGEIKKFEIGFTNIGEEPLEIKLISACECTTVDWPVLPIEPGQHKVLKVSYDSKDKSGLQVVDLDILANTVPANTFIKFELTVL